MSQLSKLAGKGNKVLEKDGKEYEVKPLTTAQIADFVVWIEEQLWNAHKRSRKYLSNEEYAANGQKLLELIATNQHDYPSHIYFKNLLSMNGMKKAAWISLSARYPELTEEDVSGMVDRRHSELAEELLAHETDPQTGTGDQSSTVPSA